MSAASVSLRGTAEERYLVSRALTAGDKLAALAFAEGQREAWRSTPEVYIWHKASVNAMESGDPGGLATPRAVRDYILEAPRARAVIDRLDNLRRVPLNISVPGITSNANASAVAEGAAKPLTRYSAATLTVAPRKFVGEIVVTAEMLRHSISATTQSLGRDLGADLVAKMDQYFLDPNLGGSITNGAPTIPSTGDSLAEIDADLGTAEANFEDADSSLDNAVWIMAPRTAAYLAGLRGTGGNLAFPNINLRTGGSVHGIPLLISSALRAAGSPGETQIVLADQSRILFGDDGQFEVTIARDASIQLDDAPSSAASQQVSLFQANLVAIRAERWCGWAAGDGAVVCIDNVTH